MSLDINRAKKVITDYLRDMDGTQDGWKVPLLSGFLGDPFTALYSCACNPCARGDISAQVGDNYVIAVIGNFLPCAPCFVNVPAREKVRAKFGIKGDTRVDVAMLGCGMCATAQELKTLKQNGGAPAPAAAAPAQNTTMV